MPGALHDLLRQQKLAYVRSKVQVNEMALKVKKQRMRGEALFSTEERVVPSDTLSNEIKDIITKLGISLEELDSSDNLLPVIGRLALRLSQTEQALEETVDALIEIQEEKLKQERQTPDLEATKRQLYETQEANHQLQERLDVLNKEREWLRAAKEYDESGISPLPPPPSKQREFRRRKSETAIATIRRAPPSSTERDEIKRLIQKSIKQDISRRQQHLF